MPPEQTPKRPIYERIAVPLVSSRAGSWFYVNVAPHLDRGLLRLTDGRWTTAGKGRVGFLKVRGARTGAERVTPLVWTRDGERVLLVASRGGDVKHPAWYRNVVANPGVRFAKDGEERSYTARTATAEERPRMWKLCARRYPGYDVYQKRAGAREIPVVVLEPADTAA
jgi:F420H(2)-dependent quinone reductase